MKPKLPKGAIQPRPAVVAMLPPYSPPTDGPRRQACWLDFQREHRGLFAIRHRASTRMSRGDRRCRAGLTVYPEYHSAKEAIAQYFRVAPEQFLFTNGTDEAIQVFINTYVDAGQEVLLLKPAYAMYRFYAESAGAVVKEVAYPPPDMEFPLQAALDAITPSTRAVLLANPNNPTGTGFSLIGIERILHRARKAVVLVDEAYYEFSGVTAITEIERVPNLFVCRTFSKVFGMAAMRLGCLFSHPANIALLHKVQSPYSVNSLAIVAAQAAVEDTAYIESYVAEVLAARELLCVGLERLGIGYVPSSANFVLARIGPRAIEVRDALRDRGILVRDRMLKSPVPSASPSAPGNRRAACLPRWKRCGTYELHSPPHLRYGRRARRCHRLVPRDHRPHCRAFHRPARSAARPLRSTRTRAAGTAIGISPFTSSAPPASMSPRKKSRRISKSSFSAMRARPA